MSARLKDVADRAGVSFKTVSTVINFDDVEDRRYSVPSLTTVSPDIPFLAEEAVRLVVRRVSEPDALAEDVCVPYNLEVRESTSS